ncbi:hypothetical protein AB0I53_39285 [Saccharopolyspora sp. NPDC050389]|uniref:hypothetical protein n=1 Tax=Saccharopolyspora sp. NPDC050389 TaxID=3155516 RepID=UPI0033EB7C21
MLLDLIPNCLISRVRSKQPVKAGFDDTSPGRGARSAPRSEGAEHGWNQGRHLGQRGRLLDYTICRDEVEFEIGGQSGFDLLATEAGLAKLVAKATEALHELRELRVRGEQ